jgi:hypothetical protein
MSRQHIIPETTLEEESSIRDPGRVRQRGPDDRDRPARTGYAAHRQGAPDGGGGAHVTGDYRGIIIAEGLDDPRVINAFDVYKAQISADGQPLDYGGKTGRWHLYYVRCSRQEIETLRLHLLGGWYAHFWNDGTIVVAFSDRLFDLGKTDRSTWREAVAHGVQQGIPEEELDFPTE